MAQNYTRQSSFNDGDTISASLFNDEYNQLVNSFSYSSSSESGTGHRHDGSAGQGGNIYRIGDLDFFNKIEADSANNRWGFWVEVGGSAVEQVRIQDGAVLPVTTNDIDLGSGSLEFKNLYLDGTANIDSLVADTADINGGTIDGAIIGAATPAAGSFTTGQFGTSLNVDGTVTADGLTVTGRVTIQDATSPELRIVDGNNINSDFLIYSPDGVNSLNIKAGSLQTDAFSISSTGNISFYEDTGTTPKFFWDASAESLGIGTTSPAQKLHIEGSSHTRLQITSSTTTDAAIYLGDTADADAGALVYDNAQNSMKFLTNASEAMRITSAGNVGIGSSTIDGYYGSSPANTRAVVAYSSASTNVDTAPKGLVVRNDNTTTSNLSQMVFGTLNTGNTPIAVASIYSVNDARTSGFSTGSLGFGTVGGSGIISERMRIDSSGRLLVGTATPVGTEQVLIASSSAGSQPQQLNLKDTNASANGNYFLVARKSDDTYVGGLRRSGTDTAMAVDGTGHLAFHISGTEVSRFDGNGNLLVGTAGTPNSLVHGTALVSSSGSGGDVVAFREDSSVNVGDRIGAFVIGNSDIDGAEDHYVGMWAKASSTNGSMDLHFAAGRSGYEGDSPNMTLDSSGNLNIDYNAVGNKFLLLNTSSAGDGHILLQRDSAYKWQITSGLTNGLQFFNYTAGSESMRIDASGNVGIGTSSPGHALSVESSSVGVTRVTITNTGNAAAGAGVQFITKNGATQVSNATLRTDNAGNFAIFTGTTGETERMRIDSSGNLLVGTTSNVGYGGHVISKDGHSANALAVINSNASNPYGPYFGFSAAAPNNVTNYFLACADSGANRLIIRSNGGIANYQANDVNLSDERVKTDIAPLGSMWDKFKALEIVTFKYKDQTHDDDNIGVIAQQVEAVAPEFVDNDGFGETPEGEEPLKTIYTADLYHATIKALQEAMTRIETLEAEVAALKGA